MISQVWHSVMPSCLTKLFSTSLQSGVSVIAVPSTRFSCSWKVNHVSVYATITSLFLMYHLHLSYLNVLLEDNSPPTWNPMVLSQSRRDWLARPFFAPVKWVAGKIVSEMTYSVLSGTLNPILSPVVLSTYCCNVLTITALLKICSDTLTAPLITLRIRHC